MPNVKERRGSRTVSKLSARLKDVPSFSQKRRIRFIFFCGRVARGFFRSPVSVFASVRPVSARLGKPFDVQVATKSRIIEVFSRRAAEDPCDGSLGRRNKSPRDDRTLQGSRHRPPKPLSGAFGLQSPLSAVLQAGSRGRPSRTVPIPFVIDCRTCAGKSG